MAREPLSDCTYCRSAGSISNGYCMICGAAGPEQLVYLADQGDQRPTPVSALLVGS